MLEISARTTVETIDAGLVRALQELGPFGKDNPAPIIALEGVHPKWIRPMGKKHLRIGLGALDAVWWNAAEYTEQLKGTLELAGKLSFNSWKGRLSPRLTLEDVRPGTLPEP